MNNPERLPNGKSTDLVECWIRDLENIVAPIHFKPRKVKERILQQIRNLSLTERYFPTKSMFVLFDNTTLSYVYVSQSAPLILGQSAEEVKQMGYKESLSCWFTTRELAYKVKVMEDVFSFLQTCDEATLLSCSVTYDLMVTHSDGRQLHVLEEMWFPDVNESCQPTITSCFLHAIADFTNHQVVQQRKCFIEVVKGNKKEVLFARTYPMLEDPDSPLSARELEVLSLFSNGLTTIQVAGKLFLTENTIKTHRQRILSKLGVQNTSEAIRICTKHNWLL